jgi:hypothetical protein
MISVPFPFFAPGERLRGNFVGGEARQRCPRAMELAA